MSLNPQLVDPLKLPALAIEQVAKLPDSPCVYFALNSRGEVLYIGQSIRLVKRWAGHHRRHQFSKMGDIKIAYLILPNASSQELKAIESTFIKAFEPRLNGIRFPNGELKVAINEDLKRRFKAACATQDITMSDVVSALVQGWLNGQIPLPEQEQSS
jgi:excinuclease UvrABC nuclease subunit